MPEQGNTASDSVAATPKLIFDAIYELLAPPHGNWEDTHDMDTVAGKIAALFDGVTSELEGMRKNRDNDAVNADKAVAETRGSITLRLYRCGDCSCETTRYGGVEMACCVKPTPPAYIASVAALATPAPDKALMPDAAVGEQPTLQAEIEVAKARHLMNATTDAGCILLLQDRAGMLRAIKHEAEGYASWIEDAAWAMDSAVARITALRTTPVEARRGDPALETELYGECLQHGRFARIAPCCPSPVEEPEKGAAGNLLDAVEPWADYHGDLPDYDHPLRCVFESGVQYAVELLAKTLKVTDYTPCDGTEEFDGDLGGTMMNIVLAAMPEDEHGDPMWPDDVRAALAATNAGPTVPRLYSDEDRNRAGEVLQSAILTTKNPCDVVDAVAEALGMRRAGA